MKTYVLYNKLSGSGKGENAARQIESIWPEKELAFLDISQITDYPSFFESIQKDDEVVVCGGDGTLNRFVNEVDGLPITQPVYYYAAGSGNDFWHDLGKQTGDVPCRIETVLKDLPYVEVQGRRHRFFNGIGYGIDGYCCEVGDQQRSSGKNDINYTSIAINGLLFHYHPTNATVIVDGKESAFHKVWLAPTMNGRFYGGGMMPTPEQHRSRADRKLSLMIFHDSNKLKTLSIFPSIFKGTHVKHSDVVTVLTGRDIKVTFDRPVALQYDGETVLGVKEYHASVSG